MKEDAQKTWIIDSIKHRSTPPDPADRLWAYRDKSQPKTAEQALADNALGELADDL